MEISTHMENNLQGLHLAENSVGGYDRVYAEQFTDTKQTGISAHDVAQAGFNFYN